MITGTDVLRDVAEDVGLNTFHNENIWPDFLKSFHSYVNYTDRDEYSHREACEALGVRPNSMWAGALVECYRTICDEPELYD